MNRILDNIAWHTLSGPHAKFSAGKDDARRYARGFSLIVGFVNPQNPNFEALNPCVEVGEHFYCSGWSGTTPSGWHVDAETTMFKMVWDLPAPEAESAMEVIRLDPDHAPKALELADLTRPGPFGLRTSELGEYFGFFKVIV